MNTGSVNSNAVNASTINYVIGALTAIAVTFAGNTEASAMVYGGNTGAVTVTVNSSSGQYHRANMVTGGTVINGTSSTIRYANYVPKYAPLDVTGSAKSYLQVYGGNSGTVNSGGTIVPNYYVEPDYTQDGTINVTIEAEANNRKIGRAFGDIPFSGLFVIPRIVPAYDIDTVIEFNGRCLAVDKIGYGNPGNINIAVNAEGVRTTVCAAAGNIDVTLGSLATNYIGVGKSSGSISVTGLVNVAIKYKNNNYYTQYYEDWLKWDVGSLNVEPLVYKVGVSNNLADRDIKVGMVSTATTKARGFINNGAILSTVASVDYGRIAGSRNSIGSITITGYPVSYSIKKPSTINNYITVSGSGYGVRQVIGSNVSSITVVGTGYANNIVKTTIAQGSAYITGTTVGIRRVVAASTGNCTINDELAVKVYKKSYGTTNMVISGSCIGSVKTTVNDCIITTSGFAKGIRNTLADAYGVVHITGDVTDTRLAIRAYSVGNVITTRSIALEDYRLAVKTYTNEGIITVDGSVPDSRLAVKAYSVGNVTTTRSAALEDYRLAVKAYMNAGIITVDGSVSDSRLAIRAYTNTGRIVLGNMVDDFRLAVRGDNEGSVDVTTSNRDFRLAVRGENEGSVDVTASNRDFRLAIKAYANTNHITLSNTVDDFRLAVRLDSKTRLDITGRTDAIANLYSNADETRQMSVPASDWANGEYLHYMEVQA